MCDVGLDYLALGQPLTTLSGGERQRIKLANELHKKAASTFMDEPTTGLHKSDIQKLLAIMNRLVDSGNTVIVIEHNPDIIKNADWIIDMGPEGGNKGEESYLKVRQSSCFMRSLPIQARSCAAKAPYKTGPFYPILVGRHKVKRKE